MNNTSTDRIEREIFIDTPRSKVWQAISNAEEFGEWFRVNLEGKKFTAGKRIQGQIMYPGYEHIVFDALVERIEPESLMSFRWHPYAIDPKKDYSKEPETLVLFELRDKGKGTLLKVTESGFDQIPLERRGEAFRMNSGGWEQQVKNVSEYVSKK